MSNEDSLHEVKETSYYRDKALTMINIFKPEEDGLFYTWLNKFEYVTDKIEVPDNKMSELFITMVDDKRLIKKCHDVNISECSYQEFLNEYIRYFNLSDETNFHRHRFMSRYQYEKESIKNYANNLRKILNMCCYKSKIKDKLCDQFVKGIRDIVIRKFLSKIPRSSFDEMVSKAIEFSKSILITSYVDEALLNINSYYPIREGIFYGWLNKFEYVVNYIGIPEDKILELFNRMIYNSVRINVMSSFPTTDFSKLSYDQLINCYLRHFAPDDINLHRNRLFLRKQYEKETIQDYADGIIKIYNKCYYETDIKDSLCELFSCGLRDTIIRRFLVLVDDLSFNEYVAKAVEFSNWDLTYDYINCIVLRLNIYKPENEGHFYVWFNKFEYIVDSIGVPDDSMIDVFNAMVNNDVQTNVKNAFHSINFSNLSYEEIIDYYLLHFSKYYEYDLHRKRFFCCKQYVTETFKIYSERLKKIYNKLNYKSNNEYELCAQFITGIFDDDIRIHICKTPSLSFDEMVATATEFKMNQILLGIKNF